MTYYPRASGKATWSKVLNGNLAPNLVIERMYQEGYCVVETYVDSPVGDVPFGSIVLTEYNGRPAKWIGGVLFQKKEDKMTEEPIDPEEEYTEDDEYDWETDIDFWDDEDEEEEDDDA